MPSNFATRSLPLAIQHQQAGRLAQAQAICMEILAREPANADTLHMLGVLALQTKQPGAALDWLARALALQPTNAICHNNFGNALKASARPADALASFQRAIELQPTFAPAHMNLGNALRDLGRLDDAIASLQKAVELKPHQAIAHFNLGNALKDAGRLDQAIASFQRAIALQPNYAEAHSSLGTSLHLQGRLDEAVASCRHAVKLKPGYAHGHFALGNALKDLKNFDQAIASYRQAATLQPDAAEFHLNLGSALFEQRQLDAAIAAYEKVLTLQPQHPQALFNLGNALRDSNRLDEAVDRYRQALALTPNVPEIHNNLGNALAKRSPQCLNQAILSFRHALALAPALTAAHSNLGSALIATGQFDEALACFQTALSLDPDSADAHLMLGMALLLHGQLLPGWREYEWRWENKKLDAAARVFPTPRWDGANLAGRTLLVHAEQGFGDVFQFSRYLPLAAQCGGPVIVECREPLIPLLQRSFPNCSFVPKAQPLPAFDLHCPLLTLPLLFQTTLESIPAQVPYLQVDTPTSARWSNRFPGPPRLKVGLVWAGNKDHKNDLNRSIPLSLLAPLAAVPGVAFYSLQKGEPARQNPPPELQLTDWSDQLLDFDHTAALIAHLDLVISVDTAVAHLAGALGKPVWTLLPFSPDWRWLLGRTDSPWYPTMRLFRQPRLGDWNSVIPQLADALSQLPRPKP